MCRVFSCLFSLLAFKALAGPSYAQEVDQITVIGHTIETTQVNSSPQTFSAARIEEADALDLSDILILSNDANITTNSRGETLVYLRNAGERQTAIYFDGAPLNIPWDNRINLEQVPTMSLGSVSVSAGPGSVLYGVNASGGVIELLPVNTNMPGSSSQLSLAQGDNGLVQGAARWMGRLGATQFMLAGEKVERDSLSGPSGSALNNTDLTRNSVNMRILHEADNGIDLSFNLLHSQSEFGIAAAQFDRPEQGRIRYWRYPEADYLLTSLRGHFPVSETARLDASVWHQSYQQSIESYANSAYSRIDDIQTDDDQSWGYRLLFSTDTLGGHLRTSLTGLSAQHDQSDVELIPQRIEDRSVFKDNRTSFGAEYERDLNASTRFAFGAGLDWLDVVETGGRGESDGFSDWNAAASLLWQAETPWHVRASFSRKARIPTLRELYGVAINRFLPNPNLQSETLISMEAEIGYETNHFQVSLIPFAQQASHSLDQINIVTGGQRLRQRINGSGSRAHGLEARFEADINAALVISGGFTAMHLRLRDDASHGAGRYVSERPELLARLRARYQHPSGLGFSAELDHRGQAYSLTDEDVFEPLERSTALNLRLAYSNQSRDGYPEWEAYLRVDNAFDSFIEPQLGLPEPGRWVRAGVQINFGG